MTEANDEKEGFPRFPPRSPDREILIFPTNTSIPGFPRFPRSKMTSQSHIDTKWEAFEERAAIMEFDGGMSREEAEREARRITGYDGW